MKKKINTVSSLFQASHLYIQRTAAAFPDSLWMSHVLLVFNVIYRYTANVFNSLRATRLDAKQKAAVADNHKLCLSLFFFKVQHLAFLLLEL